MQTRVTIKMPPRTSLKSSERSRLKKTAISDIRAVAGWSLVGLTLGLIEAAAPPVLAVGVAEVFVVLFSVGLAALVGIVVSELTSKGTE